jgi:hypothetical protein
MDSCHSGKWPYELKSMATKSRISIFASCKPDQVSRDCNGGLFFNCILCPDNFDKNY